MDARLLLDACGAAGIDFFTGVPDSQLKGLCDTLFALYGTGGKTHVVAANEGNAVALAAGHYLATGRPALVYMQNSGLGNAVNPIASLMDGKVYGLPALLVIGWRGEPGVKDEPQHAKQGEITLGQLDLLDVPYFVVEKSTTEADFRDMFLRAMDCLAKGQCAAFVVRKGGLTCTAEAAYAHDAAMSREDALAAVVAQGQAGDIFVSTTGKLSRELFELRERLGQGHGMDFLTVGCMGHASSIALGIALAKPDRRVWCLDGDGAALMHLGAMQVIAQQQPANLIHVVMNNGAHESVGGMPVCDQQMSLGALALDMGYGAVKRADTLQDAAALASELRAGEGLSFLEIDCALGARADLGRPTTTPKENRDAFMAYVMDGEENTVK